MSENLNPDKKDLLNKIKWLAGELERVSLETGWEAEIIQVAVATFWCRLCFDIKYEPEEFEELLNAIFEQYASAWDAWEKEKKKAKEHMSI